MIKIIYGNNATGKTKYKQEHDNSDNTLILDSSISDWTLDGLGGFAISENAVALPRENGEFMALINDLISENISDWGITLTQWKALVKARNFPFLYDKIFWSGTTNDQFRDIEYTLSELHKFEEIFVALDTVSLGEEEMSRLLIFIKSHEILKNTFRTIDAEGQYADAHNAFVVVYEAEKDWALNLIDLELLKKLTSNILQKFIENNDELNSESLISKIKYLLINIRTQELIEKARKIINMENSRMNFDDVNIELYSNNEITLERVSPTKLSVSKNTPFSNGERTFLVAKILVENTNKDQIILDDVFETLDPENYLKLLEVISKLSKVVLILTHSSQLEEVSEDFTGINIPIERISIDAQGSILFHRTLTTWKKLLAYLRHEPGLNDREKFERMMAKALSRFVAQVGSIHSMKIPASAPAIKALDNYMHFKEISSFLFHYENSISFHIVNQYFPILSLTSNVNSIQLIDLLITKNSSYSTDSKISISKLTSMLNNIKDSLLWEKHLYDTYTTDYNSSTESLKLKKYDSIASMHSYAVPRPSRSLIHTLDTTPVYITK